MTILATQNMFSDRKIHLALCRHSVDSSCFNRQRLNADWLKCRWGIYRPQAVTESSAAAAVNFVTARQPIGLKTVATRMESNRSKNSRKEPIAGPFVGLYQHFHLKSSIIFVDPIKWAAIEAKLLSKLENIRNKKGAAGFHFTCKTIRRIVLIQRFSSGKIWSR